MGTFAKMHVQGLLIAFLAAGLPLTAGCEEPPPPQQAPPPPKVLVSLPMEKQMAETREYTGHVDAAEMVQIRARIRGTIKAIHFKEGAEVEKDQLLYEIDPTEYEVTVSQRRADITRLDHQVELAQTEARRSTELLEQKATSQEAWDEKQTQLAVAQADLAKAQAALAQAELDLSYTKISSPIKGRVSRTMVTEGNLVGYNEPTLLTNVVSMDPIYVYFEIPERDFLNFAKESRENATGDALLKTEISVGLETETGYPHPGTIDFRDNRVDSGTGTVLLRGTLKNADRKLVPGFFARVKLPVGQSKSWLLVPETSLAADQRGRYVLVVDEEGTVQQRPVELARNLKQQGFMAIASGITASDRVVVSGLQKARPGVKVAPEDVSAEQFVSGATEVASRTDKPQESSGH